MSYHEALKIYVIFLCAALVLISYNVCELRYIVPYELIRIMKSLVITKERMKDQV